MATITMREVKPFFRFTRYSCSEFPCAARSCAASWSASCSSSSSVAAGTKRRESSGSEGRAHVGDEAQQPSQVVQREQASCRRFLHGEQVAQVADGKPRADGARAARVERVVRRGELRVLQVEPPSGGQ